MRLMWAEVVVPKGKPFTPVKYRVYRHLIITSYYYNIIKMCLVHYPCSHCSDSLLILPKFLNSEDVEFVSVDVRQEAIGLSDRLALGCASAVSHQIHTVTCTQHTQAA